MDSGETHLYITPIDPNLPPNTSVPQTNVGTVTGNVERLSSTASLPIPQLEEDFPTTGYIMTYFTNTLVGVRPIYDAYCTVLFAKNNVTVFLTGGKPVLTVWRE